MNDKPRNTNYLRTLQWVILISLILYVARSILVPICFSALLAFALYPVCLWVEKKGMRRTTAATLSVTVLMIVAVAAVSFILWQLASFLDDWSSVFVKMRAASRDFSEAMNTIGLSASQQDEIIAKLRENFTGGILPFLSSALSASALSAVMMVLIPVYSILILVYRRLWVNVLVVSFPAIPKASILQMVQITISTYYNFIKGMITVYLIVGLLNSIGLWLLNVPHSFLFGFTASILTIIPYVGIIIGAIPPVIVAWLAHDSILYPIGVIALFSFVQYLEANVIFPFAVSARLKVNTFVMLVSIFVGGLLWGVSGMILFVPLIGIIKLIADQNPGMKAISLAFGTEEEPLPPKELTDLEL